LLNPKTFECRKNIGDIKRTHQSLLSFINESDKSIKATVAFPMPPYTFPMIMSPTIQITNPLDFTTTVDGVRIDVEDLTVKLLLEAKIYKRA